MLVFDWSELWVEFVFECRLDCMTVIFAVTLGQSMSLFSKCRSTAQRSLCTGDMRGS